MRKKFQLPIFIKCVITLLIILSLGVTIRYYYRQARIKTVNTYMPKSFTFLKELQDGQYASTRLTNYLMYFKKLDLYLINRPDVNGMMGYAYYYLGQHNEAEEAYLKAVALNDKFLWYYYNLGIIYFQNGEHQRSIDMLMQGLEMNPDVIMLTVKRSKIYQDLINQIYDGEYPIEDKILEGLQNLYHLLILNHVALGQYDEVYDLSMLALRKNLRDSYIFSYFAGYSLHKLGKHQLAITYMNEHIKTKNDDAEAFNILALSARALGNELVANSAFKKAREYALLRKQSPYDQVVFHLAIF